MNIEQRLSYLGQYRAKLKNELDQMNYGKGPEGLGSAHVEARGSAGRSWAIAIAVLIVAAASVSQVV